MRSKASSCSDLGAMLPRERPLATWPRERSAAQTSICSCAAFDITAALQLLGRNGGAVTSLPVRCAARDVPYKVQSPLAVWLKAAALGGSRAGVMTLARARAGGGRGVLPAVRDDDNNDSNDGQETSRA